MRRSFVLSLCQLALFLTSSNAFRAVPSQQCASVCGDVTQTTSGEIVCSDADIQNTPAGQALQSCLNCQQNSTANDPNTGESDLRWYIYNLRFIMSSCLWGYPDNSSVLSTPCTTSPACGLYQSNMEFDSLLPNASTFDYCSGFDDRSQLQQPRCVSCLQQLSDDYYTSNFFMALVAGCEQRPSPGSLLGIDGSLFSNYPINITAVVAVATPLPTVSATSGLTLGAIVGAAIGSLVAILTLLGCCVVFFGKRRRRSNLKRAQERAMFNRVVPETQHPEPKWGQHAATAGSGWHHDDTPSSAGGYGDGSGSADDKHSFSPYSSRYTSPVSARDMVNVKQMWEAHPGAGGVAPPLPEKGSEASEAFEMERLRDERIRDRKMRELVVHDEFMQEAAERGFTVGKAPTPIIRLPSLGRDGRG